MSKVETELPPAVLLCGHGSQNPEAVKEFHSLVRRIRKKLAPQPVTGAFLKFNPPAIGEALQEIYNRGGREIIVQPITLYNADHTRNDIPEILAQFKKNHPEVHLHYGSALGLIPPVIDTAIFAIQSVMPDFPLEDCKLLVVGRGSADRKVSDQTINLCRKLHDWLDFGDIRYCYSTENSPPLDTALTQAGQSHYPHIIVLPFLLFSGHLLSEIQDKIEAAAKKYPAFSFHKAPALGQADVIAKAIIQKLTLTE